MAKVGPDSSEDKIECLLIMTAQTLKETFAAKLPAEIERVKKLRKSVIL